MTLTLAFRGLSRLNIMVPLDFHNLYRFLLMFNSDIDVTLPVVTLSANFGVTLSVPILLHYRPIDFVTLSVSCYIIGKFGVTLLIDVTLLGVITLST